MMHELSYVLLVTNCILLCNIIYLLIIKIINVYIYIYIYLIFHISPQLYFPTEIPKQYSSVHLTSSFLSILSYYINSKLTHCATPV